MDDSTTSDARVIARHRPAGLMFLTEAFRDLRTIGAVAPSGKALAHALTAEVRAQAHRPLSVLEVGAGTGAVTRALIAQLAPGSHLDVVEANPRFTERLRHLVHTHPVFTDRPGEVSVHHGYIEQVDTSRRYDLIVSGLPMTNFTPRQATVIMSRYLRLLQPGAILTYFAYLGTRPARALLASRAEAHRHRAVTEVMSAYQHRYATGCDTVWTNVPPARVWRLRRPAQPSREPRSRLDFREASR